MKIYNQAPFPIYLLIKQIISRLVDTIILAVDATLPTNDQMFTKGTLRYFILGNQIFSYSKK